MKIVDSKKVEQDAMTLLITKKLKTDKGLFTITGNGPYQLNLDGIKVSALSQVVSTAVTQIIKALTNKQIKDSKESEQYFGGRIYWGSHTNWPSFTQVSKSLTQEQYDELIKRIGKSTTTNPEDIKFISTWTHMPSVYALQDVFEGPMGWYEMISLDDTWIVYGEAMK